MSDTIIVAIIGFAASILATLISSWMTQNRMSNELDKNQAISNNEIEHIKEDMKEVKKKLDVHNGYAKKLGNIEISLASMQKDIEFLKESNRNEQQGL